MAESTGDTELDGLLEALEAFNACDHEWRDSDVCEGDPPGTKVCDKCGGGMIAVTAEEFEQMQELLDDDDEDA